MQYSLSYKRKFNITIGDKVIPVTQNCVASVCKCSTAIGDSFWRTLLNTYIAQIANCDLSDSTIVWDTAHAKSNYYNFVKTDDGATEKNGSTTNYPCTINVIAKKYNSQGESNPRFLSFNMGYGGYNYGLALLEGIKGMITNVSGYVPNEEYVVISTIIQIH